MAAPREKETRESKWPEEEEEEETKNDEIMRAERRRERDEKTAFWTTPGLRPLAEPPILDWEAFVRTHIPSDLRYKALFPNDPEKRCRMKDIDGELGVMHEYTYCAGMPCHEADTDNRRQLFYMNLYQDIAEDINEVHQEYDDIWCKATPLSQFEYLRLDNDGRTSQLEKWIEKGADIFYAQPDNVVEKYSYLVPEHFIENRLATFEFCYLERDGFESTGIIRQKMREGKDLLIGWPQEVQEKYGYLRRFLPRPPPFDPGTPTSVDSDYLPKDDDTTTRLRDSHPPAVRRASFYL